MATTDDTTAENVKDAEVTVAGPTARPTERGAVVPPVIRPDWFLNRRAVLAALVWFTIGIVILLICGLVVAGGTMFLAIAVPTVLVLSPVLLSLGAIVFVLASGFATAAGFTFVTLFAIGWLYKYWRGENPPYSDTADSVRRRIAGIVKEFQQWMNSHRNRIHPAVAQAAPSA